MKDLQARQMNERKIRSNDSRDIILMIFLESTSLATKLRTKKKKKVWTFVNNNQLSTKSAYKILCSYNNGPNVQ